MSITRRDFLNGFALTVGAGLTPWQQLMAQEQSAQAAGKYYPPSLTGLRGNHPGSNDITHPIAFGALQVDMDGLPVSEDYDLVVAGAGISGLAAAWFYRKKFPDAKILILDNHDDFGGHAKRNELGEGDNFRITYGGSESLDSPKAHFSNVVEDFLADLGVDYQRFNTYFDDELYADQGLSAGVFFDAANFGENHVAKGEPFFGEADPAEAIANFPLSESDKQALLALFNEPENYLPEMSAAEVEAYLGTISYDTFLQKHVGLSAKARRYFQSYSCDVWGYPIDGRAALEGYYDGYPGFDAMPMPVLDDEEEPYIYHFPDGNASVARMLVRAMIPGVAPGETMEDIVLAPFDYSKLDQQANNVRLRVNATVADVRNRDGGVDVLYFQDNKEPVRVRSKHCVMACYHRMMPSLMKEIGEEQRAALDLNVKTPMIYTKVLLKNWQAFKDMGVYTFYCPTAPYCLVQLDYPVNMGGYECPKNPEQAIVVHMVRTPSPYGTMAGIRDTASLGRKLVYGLPFEALEAEALNQLDAMLSTVGQSARPLVEAITINRWAHGYSHETAMLADDLDAVDGILNTAHAPIGNVHIANSDSGWSAYMHTAIDQAWRAVEEIQA
ncbi:NAD(P)-binding protein [Cardiobacteriaceae bacterium TAE3-ERU3]|nr:NAD(P)-binding protein [Cardiobacteriaceae bacterium TAE3-ERU3]